MWINIVLTWTGQIIFQERRDFNYLQTSNLSFRSPAIAINIYVKINFCPANPGHHQYFASYQFCFNWSNLHLVHRNQKVLVILNINQGLLASYMVRKVCLRTTILGHLPSKFELQFGNYVLTRYPSHFSTLDDRGSSYLLPKFTALFYLVLNPQSLLF